MTEFTDWLQNNVIDVARLLMECVILVTVVRFSRTLLRTLRASQEQLGALLRLSVSDGASQQTTSGPSSISEAFSEPPMHDAQGNSEGAPAFASERTFAPVAPAPMYSSSSVLGAINGSDRGGADQGGADRGRFESEGFSAREHSLGGRVMEEADSAVAVAEPPAATPWVAAPMNGGVQAGQSGISAPSSGRGLVQWLNSPAPKKAKRQGNPVKRAIRWLQTPTGR